MDGVSGIFDLLAAAVAINMLGFLIAYWRGTDKLTDISYALSFAVIMALSLLIAAQNGRLDWQRWAVAGVIWLWAARLGGYLLYRIHVMGRDKRFDERRENFFAFGRFWLLQGATSWIVSLPATLLITSDVGSQADWLLLAGLGISLSGLGIESVADWQKFIFINSKRNKGKWIDSGLWHYSRHPNYFGEMLMWWGMFVASASVLEGWRLLAAAAGPTFITILLLFVSGLPILEKAADKRWGKDKKYQAYKSTTSPVVLLPKRRAK